MNNTEKTVFFSSGRWKGAQELADHLGVKDIRSTPLRNMFGMKGVCFEVQRNGEGQLTRYRAYFTSGKSPIELAKARKSMGLTCGMESISIKGGAL